ncbi:MAG: hypothetical protein JWO09_1459 [Bacteroidetes bacterium]|nr:hypothetical protein [Bacteroidota bacterium]
MSRNVRLLLMLTALLCSASCFSQNTIHMKYVSTSKPVYFNTGTHIIVIDMREFLSEYERVVTNTLYWDPEKQVDYKEDGKPYRNELNYLLDSLALTNDSVFINEIAQMPHADLRNNKTEYLVQKNEFEAAIIEILKKGSAKITERTSRNEVQVISVKKKKYRHGLTLTSAFWVVKDKRTQKQIFEKLIFKKVYDAL